MRRLWLVVAAVAAALSVGAATFTGLDARDDGPDDDRASSGGGTASERDVVLVEASQAAVALTTLDASDPEASVEEWKAVTTGALNGAVAEGEAGFQQLITVGNASTSSVVREAAVQSLDVESGVARVLLAVDLTLAPAQGDPQTQNLRLVLTMAEDADRGWLASALETVAG